MMLTTTYILNLVKIITSPTDYLQHQLSIITMATHMVLSTPTLSRRISWNTIRQVGAHKHTLHLILATIALNRYHKIWYNVLDTCSHAAPPISQPCPPPILTLYPHINTTISPQIHQLNNPSQRLAKQRHTQ